MGQFRFLQVISASQMRAHGGMCARKLHAHAAYEECHLFFFFGGFLGRPSRARVFSEFIFHSFVARARFIALIGLWCYPYEELVHRIFEPDSCFHRVLVFR